MKFELKLLLVINSVFVFGVNLFAPFYALYIQQLTTSVYHIGAIWALFIFSTGLLTIIISKFENHKEYADYFLAGGFLLRAVGWTFYMFAGSLWQIYLIQLILALGEAFSTPSFNLIYSEHLTKGKVASDWGMNLGTTSFVVAAGSFCGGLIIEKLGFRAIFLAMVALALLSTILAIKYKKKLR